MVAELTREHGAEVLERRQVRADPWHQFFIGDLRNGGRGALRRGSCFVKAPCPSGPLLGYWRQAPWGGGWSF